MTDLEEIALWFEEIADACEKHYGSKREWHRDAADAIRGVSAENETKELARKAALKTIDSLTASKATLSAENTSLKSAEQYWRDSCTAAWLETKEVELARQSWAQESLYLRQCVEGLTEVLHQEGITVDLSKFAELERVSTEQTPVSPKTAIEKDGINDRGSDEYANPDTGIVDYE